MADILATLVAQVQQNTWVELCAVTLGIAYLLLAVRENILCWYAAFFSTAIFLYLFWQVKLYMESGLQVYYLTMAVYGWYQWQRGKDDSALTVTTWPPKLHIIVITMILVVSALSGFLLNEYTDARLPYIDSLTTWASIVTTFMVTRKILENWIYWFVIDSISIFLYLDRELYFTALLFAVYIVIIFFGWFAWRTSYRLAIENPA